MFSCWQWPEGKTGYIQSATSAHLLFFFSSGLLVEYGPVLGLWGVVRVGGRKQFLTGLGQFSAIGTYSELSGRP